ncbi:hypothetical protein SUGI_0493820 [Cryptomeria japonica]|uniref:uncharacterized protein LOC131045834 n=1 Tax=Cryptomeria japonica TaxID=3369 RepID=UPI002408D72B|nr:uncharacterized protein LOC131045834 [Cryptomeria japonica]GLJ25790.1 hypothetical protein SUGI_0493820 [Cryptomeria japonica]
MSLAHINTDDVEVKKENNTTCVLGEGALDKAIEVIETYDLPGGLLPLENVYEAGINEDTGDVWIKQKAEVKHHFKKADKHVQYSPDISCKMEKKKMKDIKGVKAKDMLVWVPVNEIYVDDSTPPKIHFKSIAGLSRTFPVEYYARGE